MTQALGNPTRDSTVPGWGDLNSLSPELHDMILLNLQARDLFVVQLVNKTWNAAIKGSTSLKQKMFLVGSHSPHEAWQVLDEGEQLISEAEQHENLVHSCSLDWVKFQRGGKKKRRPEAEPEFPLGLAPSFGPLRRGLTRPSWDFSVLIPPVTLNPMMTLVGRDDNFISRRDGSQNLLCHYERALLDLPHTLVEENKATFWETYLTDPPCTHARLTLVGYFQCADSPADPDMYGEVTHCSQACRKPVVGKVEDIDMESSKGLKMSDIGMVIRSGRGEACYTCNPPPGYSSPESYIWDFDDTPHDPNCRYMNGTRTFSDVRKAVKEHYGGKQVLYGSEIKVGIELMTVGSAIVVIPSMQDRDAVQSVDVDTEGEPSLHS